MPQPWKTYLISPWLEWQDTGRPRGGLPIVITVQNHRDIRKPTGNGGLQGRPCSCAIFVISELAFKAKAATLGNVLRRAFGCNLCPKWLSHWSVECWRDTCGGCGLMPLMLALSLPVFAQQVPVIFQRWIIVRKEPSIKNGRKEPKWEVEKGQIFRENQNPRFLSLRDLNRLTPEEGARRDVGAQRRHETEKERNCKLEELGKKRKRRTFYCDTARSVSQMWKPHQTLQKTKSVQLKVPSGSK